MKIKLIAFPMDAVQCAVWCPHCVRWHYHGYDDVERRRWSHRWPHCDLDGPFWEDGYWIKLAPKSIAQLISRQLTPEAAERVT